MNSSAKTGGFFGDAIDFVTSDPLFVVIGSALTAGTYGYVSGLLNVTGVQKLALEESMKAFAGMAGTAAQNYIACRSAGGSTACKVDVPGFFEAWQGQLAYRTKSTILAYGAANAGLVAKELAAWITPERLETLRNGWEIVTKSEKYAKDQEAAGREYLDAKVAECRNTIAGPDDPNFRTLCRKDVFAQATNAAIGSTAFDTTDWDVKTGDPPPPVTTDLPVAKALEDWLAAVKREGTADSPVVAKALAVVHAAKERDAQIATAKAEREARAKSAADAKNIPIGSAGASANPPSLFVQGLLLTALTAPFWGPLIAWPLWTKYKRKARR